MQITAHDFPVIAQDNHVFSRSGMILLTAASDQIARITAGMMNAGHEANLAQMQDGCWTGPDNRGLMGATVL